MDLNTNRPARFPAVLAAVAVSATLFYFGTGLTPVAALTWLAPLPVLLVAPRLRGWTAAGTAFAAFLLGTANSWSFQLHSGDTPLWPVGVVIDVGTSLVFVLAVVVFRLPARRGRPVWAAIAGPAAWAGALYVVAVSNPMGLSNMFFEDQGDFPLALQTAVVTGRWGVEFLVMFVPSVIAALCAPSVTSKARIRLGAAAAVVLAAVFTAGAVRLNQNTGDTRRVAAIAPNHYAWAPDVASPQGRALVAGYLREIDNLPAGVRTVVLPEGAFSSPDVLPADLAGPMRQAAARKDIDIVLGFMHANGERGESGSVRENFALIFPAGGGEPVRYLKQHDMVSRLGHDLVFVPSAGPKTGVEICHDVEFAEPARGYAAQGSDILAIPASDNGDNGWQHSRTALLRGMENGQAVVWADQNGSPMIADGWGRVLAQTYTTGSTGFTTITADVPIGPGATLYTKFGDWFAWLCLALTIVAPLTAYRGRNRKAETRAETPVAPARISAS
ncbi:nitrilase-related carbon-nitrogen hydrolase [Amycolatopsis taiwanensis]|uniref:Apolipoprotein N-acyltransferase n=1 Tax=Amycolatopsis taiwanensis TaxID=342230 RepID=A0A9W6QWS1_9PSEU|nr:nitrilase-related carbon-nitrogen hydrolase [Amycolatopsis taiwanensis]GLY65148.1 apolipoprotein N-acyltransferase [Amycolatopsis taiwanensis]